MLQTTCLFSVSYFLTGSEFSRTRTVFAENLLAQRCPERQLYKASMYLPGHHCVWHMQVYKHCWMNCEDPCLLRSTLEKQWLKISQVLWPSSEGAKHTQGCFFVLTWSSPSLIFSQLFSLNFRADCHASGFLLWKAEVRNSQNQRRRLVARAASVFGRADNLFATFYLLFPFLIDNGS